MAGSGEPRAVSPTGWDRRLYWRWIFYNSIAFIALLTAVAVLVWLSVDVLDLAVGNRSLLGALLVATFGAVLFGGVLGSLQWLVVRERVPVPKRRWVVDLMSAPRHLVMPLWANQCMSRAFARPVAGLCRVDHSRGNHTHRVMPDPRATASLAAKTLLPLQ